MDHWGTKMENKDSVTYYVDGDFIKVDFNIANIADFLVLMSRVCSGSMADNTVESLKDKLKECDISNDEISNIEEIIGNKTPVISPINYK